jgi:hypothetical protein
VVLAVSLLYREFVGGQMPVQRTIQRISRLDPQPKLLMAVIAAVAAPLAEEVLFRGIIFRALRIKTGFVVAALISGALFGLIHMEPFQAIQLSMLGVVLAWLYDRTGSLWPSIILHATNNLVTLVVMLAGLHRYAG